MKRSISVFFIYYVYFINVVPLQGQLNEIGPVIKKCMCKANEAQSRTDCIITSPLYIQIWNESKNDADLKNISSLLFVIQPLECPPDSVIESLFEWAFISPEGKLMNGQFQDDLYCIENVVNDAGVVSQRTEKCTIKRPLHICCEIDEYMDSSGRCTKIPRVEMTSSISDWLNNFRYSRQDLQCTNSEMIHDRFTLDTPISVLQDYLLYYEELTNNTFCLGMYGDENELYPGITYCYSSELSMPDRQLPEVRYCCEKGQAYNLSTERCINHTEQFTFPENFEWPSDGARTSLSIMNCSHFVPISASNETMHYFLPNGSVHTESGNIIHNTEYCLGIIITETKTHHSGLTCLKDEFHYCPWRWKVYRVCLGISSLFLTITLIVYIGVPELRKRIAGFCLISELLALLVSQITLIVIQTNQREFSAPGCLAAGIVEIIFVLASFFWLNIMCYDVWTTFRVLRPFSEKIFNAKLFIKYSLYGWGFPILVGVTAVVLQITDMEMKPNFTPQVNCFFRSDDLVLQWVYMYGIILTLLLINLFFFVHLAFTMIRSHMENMKHLRGSAGNASECDQNIENFKLHGKLFIIMGLPWIIEAFTSFATPESECYIWFLDLINMLRGVLIFVIFVCKKSTLDKLIAAWCPSLKPAQLSSQASRKTSTTTISLMNWLPSIRGRKISKVSMTSGGHINLEALKEESNEDMKDVNLGMDEDGSNVKGESRSKKKEDNDVKGKIGQNSSS